MSIGAAAAQPVEAPRTRLQRRLAALAEARRAGLVTFVTGGDPTPALSTEILAALADGGADLVEIGLPFSDPMADGPSIQRANLRALAGGMNVAHGLELAQRLRAHAPDLPIVLMGYLNPLLAFGFEAFARSAAAAGIDGVILVDLPLEEAAIYDQALRAAGIARIPLTAPTTPPERLAAIAQGGAGFIYHVSVAGVTGGKAAGAAAIRAAMQRHRAATDLPVAIGFGIRDAHQARAAADAGADLVVVGSALVDTVAAAIEAGTPETAPHRIRAQVATLAAALRAP